MNVEERLSRIEERLSILEKIIATKKRLSEASDGLDIEGLIVTNIEKIGPQDLAVLCLKMKPKQTKTEIANMFKEFGKAHGDWFNGSNFNRLVSKNIVIEDGVNENKVRLYSLSKSGDKVTAQKIIDTLKEMKS
ncbi:hypothetical protein [Nitrososphaera viennensis]|uniref:Uncharacterized protein n=1 Tax=Nitrososphaera viennensis TaxID=1034015 RepID=A0A977IEF1_9ARCH|nr:hypothetical protein [Nitrososphaera viennensis]UVS69255.1 hypothetical protein NWT39_00355 [Nitrososphaera viennensis]